MEFASLSSSFPVPGILRRCVGTFCGRAGILVPLFFVLLPAWSCQGFHSLTCLPDNCKTRTVRNLSAAWHHQQEGKQQGTRSIGPRRFILTPPSATASSSSSSMGGNNERKGKEDGLYAPSQSITDTETGETWRLCAGAAVLNSRHELLVGERLGVPGAWQAPQGGVDGCDQPETILQASHRELYEEMGLVVGTHVQVVYCDESSGRGVRYRTGGSGNWISRAGFAGQELHWTIYRCIDARGDSDPSLMCDLAGKNGEKAEFSAVKWKDTQSVLDNIWEKKSEAYKYLKTLTDECTRKWQDQEIEWDVTGKWSRDASQSIHVIEGLVKRGLTREQAAEEAAKPYLQSWKRSSSGSTSWIVSTFDTDGETPRRELEYMVGEWTEKYKGSAVIFGDSGSDGFTLKRRTFFLMEPDAEPDPICHVTITEGPKGLEESRRYKKGEKLWLRRTLWPNNAPEGKPHVSTEVFVRKDPLSPHQLAIQAALETSRKYGPQSPEARVAWEEAEEIEDSVFSPCSKRCDPFPSSKTQDT
uniref:Nudix hydrolase domain-containing protein n=2 Tax=Amphora coffeiformis TaxID=265554 RepID=A0A7S3KYI4_9STRA